MPIIIERVSDFSEGDLPVVDGFEDALVDSIVARETMARAAVEGGITDRELKAILMVGVGGWTVEEAASELITSMGGIEDLIRIGGKRLRQSAERSLW